MDQPTDQKCAYRVACLRLKRPMVSPGLFLERAWEPLQNCGFQPTIFLINMWMRMKSRRIISNFTAAFLGSGAEGADDLCLHI